MFWIARNRNNDLTLFVTKPVKDEKLGWWWIDERIIYLEYFDELSGQFVSLVDHQFDYVKWEDDEPVEVDIIKKPIRINKQGMEYYGWLDDCDKCQD